MSEISKKIVINIIIKAKKNWKNDEAADEQVFSDVKTWKKHLSKRFILATNICFCKDIV